MLNLSSCQQNSTKMNDWFSKISQIIKIGSLAWYNLKSVKWNIVQKLFSSRINVLLIVTN